MFDMEILEFVRVKRLSQMEYLKVWERDPLRHCKSLEGQVDKALAKRGIGQGSLI